MSIIFSTSRNLRLITIVVLYSADGSRASSTSSDREVTGSLAGAACKSGPAGHLREVFHDYQFNKLNAT
jgi:hypothetical protein